MTSSRQIVGITFASSYAENGELFITWTVSLPEAGEVFRLHMDEELAIDTAKQLVGLLIESKKS